MEVMGRIRPMRPISPKRRFKNVGFLPIGPRSGQPVEKCNPKRQRGSSTTEFSEVLTLADASGYISPSFSTRWPERGKRGGIPTFWSAKGGWLRQCDSWIRFPASRCARSGGRTMKNVLVLRPSDDGQRPRRRHSVWRLSVATVGRLFASLPGPPPRVRGCSWLAMA